MFNSFPVDTQQPIQCRTFTTFAYLHLFILPLWQSETRITVPSGSQLLSKPPSYGLRARRAENKRHLILKTFLLNKFLQK
jgi:hypothetical protein